MAYKVSFADQAALDLENILDHYYAIDKNISRNYYSGLKKIIGQLMRYPQSGRLIPELYDFGNTLYREIVFEVFRVIYRLENKELIIVRILDCRQLFKLLENI